MALTLKILHGLATMYSIQALVREEGKHWALVIKFKIKPGTLRGLNFQICSYRTFGKYSTWGLQVNLAQEIFDGIFQVAMLVCSRTVVLVCLLGVGIIPEPTCGMA